MRRYLLSTLDANREELVDDVTRIQLGYSIITKEYAVVDAQGQPPVSIRFDKLENPDLYLAIHNASLSGMKVRFDMRHVEMSDGRRAVYAAYAYVDGQLVDLYDFRYGPGGPDTFAPIAAAVQAGFQTLGVGGRVYAVEVNLNATRTGLNHYFHTYTP